MNDKTNDTSSVQHLFWKHVYEPVLSTIHFNPHSSILNIGFKENSLLEELSKLAPEGKLTYAQFDPITEQFASTVDVFPQENLYDFIIGYGIRRHFPTDLMLLLQQIEKIIKPSGMVLLMQVNHTSSLDTYTHLVETGDFPSLMDDSSDAFEDFADSFEQAITHSPFSLHSKKNVKGNFELKNVDSFEIYLQEIAYLYKPVISEDINDEIIKRQVNIFKEQCIARHAGKYLYEYDVNFITLLK